MQKVYFVFRIGYHLNRKFEKDAIIGVDYEWQISNFSPGGFFLTPYFFTHIIELIKRSYSNGLFLVFKNF